MNDQSTKIPVAGGVIDPVSERDFFEQYWEKKPLHIARTSTNKFEHLISEQVIESLLSTHSFVYPSVQLSKTGQVIPVESYTHANQFIVNERIVEGYQKGSTIVMSLVQKIHPPLMQFCRAVQSGFGMPCQTNVYLSPPGNQGFNPHHDTHDVFILQVSGKKTFSFYDGGAHLPTVTDKFDSNRHSVGQKTEEIELTAGDTLYIPRGFVHDAVADANVASLHITLGVYPILMHTLVNKILTNATNTDVRLRESVFNSNSPTNISNALDAAHAKHVVLDHLNNTSIENALADLLDEDALEAKQDLSGQLSGAVNRPINPDSQFNVKPLAIISVQRDANQLFVRTHGAILSVPDPLAQAIEWCLEQSSLQLDQIPNLTTDQQLALAEKLVAHGVLTHA